MGGDDDAGEALPDSMEIDEPAAEGDGDDEIEEAEGGRPEDVVLVLLDRPGRDSILEMQIVAFDAQGGVAISPYLDGYPFPCYVVLRDVRELPETLAAALKQWFEFHHAA